MGGRAGAGPPGWGASRGAWRGSIQEGRENRGGREGAQVVLADGGVCEVYLVGASAESGVVAGEVVFNTALSG